MEKLKFQIKENKTLGTHSFYGVPVFTGTRTQEQLMKLACRNTSYEESIGRAILTEYTKIIQDFLMMGYRCQIGEEFLTVYPNLTLSVKDELNPDKTIKTVATADMVHGANAVTKVGCTVSPKFSKKFALEVGWYKTDKEGNEVTDDATEGNENVNNGTDNTQTNPSSGDDSGNGFGG